MFEKRVMTCTLVDKSTDQEKPHFDLFFTTISMSEKMFFTASKLKKALRNTATRAAWYGPFLTMAN